MDVDDRSNHVGSALVSKPPAGLAVFALVGPSFVWAAEYIGSGEVVIASRTGAILGTAVLWAVIVGVFLKFWIGISGARYTVCTGEAMMDMFDRIPGPRHWVVWVVLVVQLCCGILSIGSLASAAGAFLHSLIPVNTRVLGWLAALFAVGVVWSGVFDVLKIVMSVFVLVITLGAVYIAVHVLPGAGEFLAGLTLKIPAVPSWAASLEGVSRNPWEEVLPVLGWGAGGFASQVWYTYWVLGAGYGAAAGRGYGRPADVSALRQMPRETAKRIRQWCRVLYLDATIGLIIGVVVTGAFLIAGAGILGAAQRAPGNQDMAEVLSELFALRWNAAGGTVFKICGAVAMISTLIGLLAGWPRLLADGVRICIPGFGERLPWKWQFRLFVIVFFVSSMAVVFTLGLKPIFLVKVSSIVEGVLLTALQAIWVAVGLFWIMPRLLSRQAYEVLKPSPVFGLGLLATFCVFGYICATRIPSVLAGLLSRGN